MNFDLIKVRLVAAGYQILSLVILALLGVLFSDELRGVIVENAGTGVAGTVIVLSFDALVKHIRNVSVIKTYNEKLGGADKPERPVLV